MSSISLLPHSNFDTISHIQFNSLNQLAAVAWDGSLRVFSIDTPTVTPSSSSSVSSSPSSSPFLSLNFEVPLLSSAWNSNDLTKLYCGGIDGSLIEVDTLEQSSTIHPPSHPSQSDFDLETLSLKGIRSVEYQNDLNCIVVGRYNGELSLVDLREGLSPSHCHRLQLKCSSMGNVHLLNGTMRAYCSTNTRDILIVDIRNLKGELSATSPVDKRDSGLLEQIRVVRPFWYVGGQSFQREEAIAVGSVQSRVAIDFFNVQSNAKLHSEKFAWKAHRSPSDGDGQHRLWPINEMVSLSPTSSFCNSLSQPIKSSLLITGGSDGYVNVWDLKGRKRIHQYEKGMGKHTIQADCEGNANGGAKAKEKLSEEDVGGVTAMDLSEGGDLLAVAYGYNWEWGNPEDEEEMDGMSVAERKTKMKMGTKLVVKAILPNEIQPKGQRK